VSPVAAGDSALYPARKACLSCGEQRQRHLDELLGRLWKSAPQQARKVPHHFWRQSHLLMMMDKKFSLMHCPCVWLCLGFMSFLLNDEATGVFESQEVDKWICCLLGFLGLHQFYFISPTIPRSLLADLS